MPPAIRTTRKLYYVGRIYLNLFIDKIVTDIRSHFRIRLLGVDA